MVAPSGREEEGDLDLQLGGKLALITGASKGIWPGDCAHSGRGGMLGGAGRRSADELDTLRKDILSQHPVKVELYPGDLSTTESMVALAGAAEAMWTFW